MTPAWMLGPSAHSGCLLASQWPGPIPGGASLRTCKGRPTMGGTGNPLPEPRGSREFTELWAGRPLLRQVLMRQVEAGSVQDGLEVHRQGWVSCSLQSSQCHLRELRTQPCLGCNSDGIQALQPDLGHANWPEGQALACLRLGARGWPWSSRVAWHWILNKQAEDSAPQVSSPVRSGPRRHL